MSEEINSRPEPAIIVIFGITGDLSNRYLLPSLYHLFKDGQLHKNTTIVGVTRKNISSEELFKSLELKITETEKEIDRMAINEMRNNTEIVQMDLNDSSAYLNLLNKLNNFEEGFGQCMNRLYYLSIPPVAHPEVIKLLGENQLNKSCQHGNASTRLLIEKPFGMDLESAKELITSTNNHFKEEQIFRIDHYVAKETVQNILTFRFKNPIFEEMWNNQHISKIEIIAKEKIGILGRAVFYEPLGALRDFIQSHLMQILGIITTDKPNSLDSDAIHSNKQAALNDIKPVPTDSINLKAVRGQYKSYREEVDNPKSNTETFAAVELFSNNPRWQNVPMRLITGKSLDERKTEVIVYFHSPQSEGTNELRFRIQPNEGIEIDLETKIPGYNYDVQTTAMDFSYKDDFKNNGHPNAYERVLVDAIKGDRTLFATNLEVIASWKVLQPVIEAWSKDGNNLQIYEDGSVGPPLPWN